AELLSAFLETAAQVVSSILDIVRTLGVNAPFLLYREPAYLRGLEDQRDQALVRYLKEHRASWAQALMEYIAGSAAKRNETNQRLTRSDLQSICDGVAKLSEELMIHALQSKALASLRIRELEK